MEVYRFDEVSIKNFDADTMFLSIRDGNTLIAENRGYWLGRVVGPSEYNLDKALDILKHCKDPSLKEHVYYSLEARFHKKWPWEHFALFGSDNRCIRERYMSKICPLIEPPIQDQIVPGSVQDTIYKRFVWMDPSLSASEKQKIQGIDHPKYDPSARSKGETVPYIFVYKVESSWVIGIFDDRTSLKNEVRRLLKRPFEETETSEQTTFTLNQQEMEDFLVALGTPLNNIMPSS